MRIKQVAERLGKHGNTVRNWTEWYAEFLSPQPPRGESRIFTDGDLRILAYIGELSDKGYNRATIHDFLKSQTEMGRDLPPAPVVPAGDEEPTDTVQVALALREAHTQIALRDAEIQRLQQLVQELQVKSTLYQAMADKDRIEYNRRYDELMERYTRLSDRRLDEMMERYLSLSGDIEKEREQHRLDRERLEKTILELRGKTPPSKPEGK